MGFLRLFFMGPGTHPGDGRNIQGFPPLCGLTDQIQPVYYTGRNFLRPSVCEVMVACSERDGYLNQKHAQKMYLIGYTHASINQVVHVPTNIHPSYCIARPCCCGQFRGSVLTHTNIDATIGHTVRASPLCVLGIFYSQHQQFRCTTVSIARLIAARATSKVGQANLRKPRRRRTMPCL